MKIKKTNYTREQLRKKALDKKPTAEHLRKKGISMEELSKIFGEKIPPKLAPIVKGKRGGKKRFKDKRKSDSQGISSKKPFVDPTPTEIPVPDWFKINKPVDVSIIVPLYKSQEVIREQIINWTVENNLVIEIIYVDDACPNQSYQVVLSTWEQKKQAVGKIFRNNVNSGFASACNIGAKKASGKYLVFLNADVVVTPNWLNPMIKALQNTTIGLVGNLQLKPDKITIDSAGSEWDWNSNSFPHLGRNIKLNNAHPHLLSPGEREMVTAACIAISKDLFYELDGFDTHYRIGYWEDADLSMKVHQAGKKIFYTPESKVIHRVGHSHSSWHNYIQANQKLFMSKWVETGLIDRWIAHPRKEPPQNKKIKSIIANKIVGCVIVCNEEEFLEASVDSASSIVDKWIIVVGGNEYAYKAKMCNSNGLPTDNTLKISYDLAKKYGGTVIEPPGRLWKDKIEMRNAYASQLTPGDWMFLLDGDEVYKEYQLKRIVELMRSYEALVLQFWVFWNNMETIGTEKWDQFPQERIIKWREGYHYANKQHLHVTNNKGNLVKDTVPCWRGQERMYYHYSWVRPIEKIRQKLAYYKYQTGLDNDRYVDEVFLKWRESPELLNGKTHPMGGGGYAKFNGFHPKNIQQLISSGKLDFI